MKRFNYKLLITLLVVVAALNIFSEISQQPDQTLFNGKVKLMGEEYFLLTGDDFFSMELAPADFLTENNITITNKQELSVKGVLDGDVIIVFSIINGDDTIELRNASGKPKWDQGSIDKDYYVVDSDKCIGCRLCVSKCPTGAISMEKGVAVIDIEKCIACGICANGDNANFKGCPVKAIKKAE